MGLLKIVFCRVVIVKYVKGNHIRYGFWSHGVEKERREGRREREINDWGG